HVRAKMQHRFVSTWMVDANRCFSFSTAHCRLRFNAHFAKSDALDTLADASAPPDSRTLADNPAKQSAQVCLVGEPAVECDRTQGCVCREHEPLRSLDPPTNHVLVRRFVETVAKGAAKVRQVQARDRGEILVPDRSIEMRIDVVGNLPDLPGGQAATRLVLVGRRCLSHSAQDVRSTTQTILCSAVLIVQCTPDGTTQLEHRRSDGPQRKPVLR